MSELATGAQAPQFTLPRDGGATISLSDFKGRKVVLYFYPKDNTSGCTVEAIDFTALLPEFEKADTAVVGVSPDSPASHDAFCRKHGLGVILASDEDKSVLSAYGVWTEKSMYGRRYMGVERTTVLVDRDGRIAQVWPKVKVKGHAEAVLEAARKLA